MNQFLKHLKAGDRVIVALVSSKKKPTLYRVGTVERANDCAIVVDGETFLADNGRGKTVIRGQTSYTPTLMEPTEELAQEVVRQAQAREMEQKAAEEEQRFMASIEFADASAILAHTEQELVRRLGKEGVAALRKQLDEARWKEKDE